MVIIILTNLHKMNIFRFKNKNEYTSFIFHISWFLVREEREIDKILAIERETFLKSKRYRF